MSLCKKCSEKEAKLNRQRTYFDSVYCQDCRKELPEKTPEEFLKEKRELQEKTNKFYKTLMKGVRED